MKPIAHKTYIACWNPYELSPYTLEKYIQNIFRHKLWLKTNDIRWRSSIHDCLGEHIDNPKGANYCHDLMHRGDRLFVLRTGSNNPQENMILYSGFFETDPELGRDWRNKSDFQYHLKFHEDVILHPLFHSKFTTEYLSTIFPAYQWSGSNRGFVLDDADALRLEQEWYDFFSQYDEEFKIDLGPLYCQHPDGFHAMYSWTDENNQEEHGRAWCYIDYLINILK